MKKLIKLQLKRIFVFALAVVMVFSSLPAISLAQEYVDPERVAAAEKFGQYTEGYYEALGLANWSDEALLDEAIRLYDAKEYDALRSFLATANDLLDDARKESLLAAYSEEYAYLLDPPAQSSIGKKLLGAPAATEWTADNTSGSLSNAVLKITKADGSVIEKSGYSINSACSAAGDGGTVTIPKGIWYVDSIQDTYGSYKVTIEGETKDPNDTKIVARTGQGGFVDSEQVTSVGFMGTLYNDWVNKGKAYNSKAVLRIGNGDTTVKNLTLDGGTFGSKSVTYALTGGGCNGNEPKTGTADFTVLRCNGNNDKNKPTNILLDNVVISGQSSKTTIQVGTSSAYANVTARKSVIGQNGSAFYAAADKCSGSIFTTVDTWIEGFALGDAESMNLGAGYYTVSFGGQTGHITIPSAIQFYKDNGESLSGMKNILQQGAGEGTTVVAKMTKDLCDSFNSTSETKLYGQTADELYAMIVEFRTALASLADDNDVDVSEELAALDAVIGNQDEPAAEDSFVETKEENLEVTIAEGKAGTNEETGLPNVVEAQDETLKDLSDNEKEALTEEVNEILKSVSENTTMIENNKEVVINVKEDVASDVENAAKDKAVENAKKSGIELEKTNLKTEKKLSMELQSLPVIKDSEGKSHVEKIVWEIKPVIVVSTADGEKVHEEIITNENLSLNQPLKITLPVKPTQAEFAEITHISDDPDKYPTEVFKRQIQKDKSGNLFVEIELTHFSQVFQSDLSEVNVAEIVGGNKYPSLNAAFEAAGDNQTVRLLADVTETCTVPAEKTVILTGGIYKLTGVITANGTIKVYDGSFADVPVGNVKLLGGIFDSCPEAELCETGFVATKDENAETYTVHPNAKITDREAITANLADVSGLTPPLMELPTLFGKADTNAAFTFEPLAAQDNMGNYAKWNADFEVSFDNDVAKDSLILVGSYGGDTSAQYKNLGFFWPYAYEKTGNPFRLLKSVGKYVNYGELFTQVGGSFDCGLVNLSEANVGTTMTVRLYMYEANSQVDADGAKKILVSEKTYKISEVSSFKDNNNKQYIYSGTTNTAIPTSKFYINNGIVQAENDVPIDKYTAYFTAGKAVASIGTGVNAKYYASLEEAIAAVKASDSDNQTIKILCDINDAKGLSVDTKKRFTIDFQGHEYTVNKPGAGSTGTTTQAFQLIKGQTITFKNGIIRCNKDNLNPITPAADNKKNIKRIIQNYADFTLENMTIDGTNLCVKQANGDFDTNKNRAVIESACGNVNIKGSTTIIDKMGDVNGDVAALNVVTNKESYPAGTHVIVGNADEPGKVGEIGTIRCFLEKPTTGEFTESSIIVYDGKIKNIIEANEDGTATTDCVPDNVTVTLNAGVYATKLTKTDYYVDANHTAVKNTDEKTNADYPWMVGDKEDPKVIVTTRSGLLEGTGLKQGTEHIATLSGGGKYVKEIADVTLKAAPIDNFEFIGWYKGSYAENNLVSKLLECKFKAPATDTEYIAVYQANEAEATVTVETTGNAAESGTVTVKEVKQDEEAERSEATVGVGSKVELTATIKEDVDPNTVFFICWTDKNSGAVVSTNSTFQTTVLKSQEVEATFLNEGAAIVNFNDDQNNLLMSGMYAASKAKDVTDVVAISKKGQVFNGWVDPADPEEGELSNDQVKKMIQTAANAATKRAKEGGSALGTVNVKAQYGTASKYKVILNIRDTAGNTVGETVTIEKNIGEAVVLKAVEREGSLQFKGFSLDERGENYITQAMELPLNPDEGVTYTYYAVYGENQGEITRPAVITMGEAYDASTSVPKIGLTMSWALPEGAKLIKAGFLFTYHAPLTISKETLSQYQFNTTLTGDKGSFTNNLNVSGVQQYDMYFVGYVKYQINETEYLVLNGTENSTGGTLVNDESIQLSEDQMIKVNYDSANWKYSKKNQ